MDVTAGVAAALATLSQAAHDPGLDDLDLERLLHEFAHDIKLAVRSYLGMSLSIATAAGAFCLTAMDELTDGANVATSLHLPLQASASATVPSTVTFYASQAGALVDLAADLTWILSLAPDVLILDGHLTIPDEDSASSLGAISLVNQAIGVLIDRGCSPEDAFGELQQLSRRAGLCSAEFAGHLLDGQ
ncbi:MAG: ANTAR domain-containing protein [Allobranchiibius sp.]